MANEQPMTDAEVQGAFREAERFVKLLDAFAVVRDVAQRHVRMKQEIDTMEKRKANLTASIAETQAQKAKAEAAHAEGLVILNSEYTEKRKTAEDAHKARTQELADTISRLVKQRESAQNDAATAAAGSKKRIAELDQKVLDAEAKANDAIAQIEAATAAKQAELDRVRANFDAFLSTHNLARP